MNRDEFDGIISALTLPLAKPITDAQIDGLWSRYQGESAATWRYAVNSAVQAGKWPSPAGWKRYVEDGRRETALGVGTPGQRRKLCQCGGSLAWPMTGFLGITFPLVELTEEERGRRAEHQAQNPHSWSFGTFRQCTSCQAIYVQAGEDVTIADARGIRRVQRGELRLTDDVRPHLGPIPPLDSAYAAARMLLIRDLMRKRVRAADVPDRLLALADDFPLHADALVREAAERAAEVSARDRAPIKAAALVESEVGGLVPDTVPIENGSPRGPL